MSSPVGSGTGFRRPVLIVQGDSFNASRISTAVVVPLTSNERLAAAPGNVLLPAESTGLPKHSVANARSDAAGTTMWRSPARMHRRRVRASLAMSAASAGSPHAISRAAPRSFKRPARSPISSSSRTTASGRGFALRAARNSDSSASDPPASSAARRRSAVNSHPRSPHVAESVVAAQVREPVGSPHVAEVRTGSGRAPRIPRDPEAVSGGAHIALEPSPGSARASSVLCTSTGAREPSPKGSSMPHGHPRGDLQL